MIVDTNVVSEMMRGDPTDTVSAWLRTCDAGTLGIAAVTVQEITFGLTRMTPGVRQQRLAEAWDRLMHRDMALFVHPLSSLMAQAAALLQVRREQPGRHLGVADAQIAATALVLGHPLATRNTRDFEGLGVTLINPWE